MELAKGGTTIYCIEIWKIIRRVTKNFCTLLVNNGPHMKVRGRETGSFKSFWELPFQFEQFVIFLLIGVKQHKLTQLFGSLLELSRVLGSEGSGTTAKGIGRKIMFYRSWWFFKSFTVPSSVLSTLKNHQIFMPKTDWVEWRSLVFA